MLLAVIPPGAGRKRYWVPRPPDRLGFTDDASNEITAVAADGWAWPIAGTAQARTSDAVVAANVVIAGVDGF